MQEQEHWKHMASLNKVTFLTSLTNLGRLPNRELQITGEELIVTGGYGAGQDFIDVYHFRYDPKKKSLLLQTTDQLKPNEL